PVPDFRIQLVLRKTPHPGVNMSIVPHHSRSDSERLFISSTHEKLDGFDRLPPLIENAKTVLSISTRPDRPYLTILDSHGLILWPTKQHSPADIKLVEDVVKSCMEEPRNIIMEVVSAKNYYVNQVVLMLASECNPQGTQTPGVITKPDTLIHGFTSERTYVSPAKSSDDLILLLL
ncbi:hypothetical protein F5884DRAFT_687985, partial [Xylogone sp. PMI_703]